MKRAILIILAGLGSSLAIGQDLKKSEVPAAVTAKFASLYPNVTNEEWEKEDGNYEVEFETDNKETNVIIDASGNLVGSSAEVGPNDLPKAIIEYAGKNFPGKKLKEMTKMTDSKGIVTYEIQIHNDEMIFDANGNFVKKEEEKDDDDKDDDDKKKKD